MREFAAAGRGARGEDHAGRGGQTNRERAARCRVIRTNAPLKFPIDLRERIVNNLWFGRASKSDGSRQTNRLAAPARSRMPLSGRAAAPSARRRQRDFELSSPL